MTCWVFIFMERFQTSICANRNVTKFVPGELIVDIVLAESQGSPWQVTLLSTPTKTVQIFISQLRLGDILDIFKINA